MDTTKKKPAAKPAAAKSDSERDALVAKAQELGISTRKNMTVETLKRKIDEANGVSAAPTKKGRGAGKGKGSATPKKQFAVFATAYPESLELSHIANVNGLTAQLAVANGVRSGLLQPDTPYVALPTGIFDRIVEIETVRPEPKYIVKKAAPATRKRRSQPKAAAQETSSPEIAPPAPGQAASNPFVV